METLETLRMQIDRADDTLLRAFCARMTAAAKIGQWKREQGLPIHDPEREQEKLRDILAKLPPEWAEYGVRLYFLLFAMSREYQER